MTRTDPPKRRSREVPIEELDTGWEEEQPDSVDVPVDSLDIQVDIDEDVGEITTGEAEVSLHELGLGPDLEPGDDPCPSPFDRPTIMPPIPEHEYVAQMMRELPESERLPISRSLTPRASLPGTMTHSITPVMGTNASDIAPTSSRRPTKMPDAPLSSRPTPVDLMSPPLTLDLSDDAAKSLTRDDAAKSLTRDDPGKSAPPHDSGDPEQTGVRERSAFPAARPVAPPLEFGSSSGDALELVGARAQSIKPSASPSVTMREVRDRFDVGDFTGALVLAEGILEHDTENADALLYAEHCRDVLKQMYLSRLGGVRRVPQVAMGPDELRWLALDHRAGFLLSLVDGRCTIDEVLDMSGMPDLDALRVLMQLLQQNVIKVL
jgi:hypothetical protein